MKTGWTFARTISVGFAVVVALTVLMATVALFGLHHVVERKDRVINSDTRQVLGAERLLELRDARASANRGFLISGEQRYLDQQHAYEKQFGAQLAEVRQRADTARTRQLADQVATLQARFQELDLTPVRLRTSGAPTSAVTAAWTKIDPQRVATDQAMNELLSYEQTLVTARARSASAAAGDDVRLILGLLVAIVLASALVAAVLIRRLRDRIGRSVAEVQSSSSELQATATQQAAGAREQASTVGEISTTTSELLASARQIASTAQHVAEVAELTAQAGRSGRMTVERAQESMAEIRRQVDAVVDRMIEMGEKSERIGAVLDIASDVAQQTTVLAINSTIEAADPGVDGRRFAMVADEIRQLADRVNESTKEIRDLIDVTRGAVTVTMTATELGSRAVDAGHAQVDEVALAFEEIAGLVAGTIEAAREIELATRQQTIAVEQVTQAIADVAQTSREADIGSGHTLETASQLQHMSTRLRGLVESPRERSVVAAGHR
jgi:CHASE3 domain sensor protein